MDRGGIERSLCFPTFPRFCGQVFLEASDKDLALACVRAYNDWMVEEWCGDSAGRLVPLCLVPLWDAELAADEVRRNAARGVRAVAFSELPQYLDLPSLYDANRHWDPFLDACSETGTVICMHIGSASRMVTTATDAPPGVQAALLTVNSQLCLTDWVMSGALARHRGLKLALSESQVGWMPYLLQRLDTMWTKHRGTILGLEAVLDEPPSSLASGRVYGCVFDDAFGIAARDTIGIGQITYETDYPHMDSTWPDTRAEAAVTLASLTDDEIQRVIRGNAIELFHLDRELPASAVRGLTASARPEAGSGHG